MTIVPFSPVMRSISPGWTVPLSTGLHTRICCVAHELRVSTTSFDVGKNRVAFCTEGKGEEGGADVCSDASDDDLGFVCRADSGLEISVVPGAGDVLAECAAMDVFSSG